LENSNVIKTSNFTFDDAFNGAYVNSEFKQKRDLLVKDLSLEQDAYLSTVQLLTINKTKIMAEELKHNAQ